jgi:hypothetical protein
MADEHDVRDRHHLQDKKSLGDVFDGKSELSIEISVA